MAAAAYCWPLSVLSQQADEVNLYISFNGTCSVHVVDSRNESDVIYGIDGVICHEQSTPLNASADGCDWQTTVSIPTSTLSSSFYLVYVVVNKVVLAEACFVVRAANNDVKRPILFVLSNATWNAYNDWGGTCLYSGATCVSFQRPLAKGFLSKPDAAPRKAESPPGNVEATSYTSWAVQHGYSVWSGSSGYACWERLMLLWLVDNGFEFDVAFSMDLHEIFLCAGHDEYWSLEMRKNVDCFRRSGGHLCILSGNTCFWHVRMVSANNNSNSVVGMVCYKYSAALDPAQDSAITSMWCDRRTQYPETQTVALSFAYGGYSRYGSSCRNGSAGFTVYNPEHWVFGGLDIGYGDIIGSKCSIVAYEVDGCEFVMKHGVPSPVNNEYACCMTILAIAPASLWNQQNQPSRYRHEPGELEAVVSCIYGENWQQHKHKHVHNHATLVIVEPVDGSGMIFNAGVTDWVYALNVTKRGVSCCDWDEQISRITTNVLQKMLQSSL